MTYTRKRDGALILTPIRKVPDEKVALSNIKRLTFAFKLSGNTNTLPDHLDAILEVFGAFNRDRNAELIPDCISLQFDAYSRKTIDLPPLYSQLKDFLDPFKSKNWHTPALSINTHHTNKKTPFLSLVLTWQDKTYEQYIKRPMPTIWGE